MNGDEELERRLAAYADARLRPDPSGTQRTRAAVMAEAERVLGAGADGAGAGIQVPSPAAPVVLAHRRRAPIFALLAAALLVAVAVGGAAALTGPGQPFYQARLWFEANTLPADPAAREAAQLSRLQARLDEAHAALQGSDADAVGEALAAYAATLDAIAAEPADGTNVRDRVEAALANHIAVLTGLLDQVSPTARGAIQSAIDRSGQVLQKVEAGNGGNGTASPAPGRGGSNGNGNASPGPGQGGGPSLKPSPPPKASPSPKPNEVRPSPGPPSPKP